MNERQLKSVIRQTFRLQASADGAVLRLDTLLARTMDAVRNIVEKMPNEGLLRKQSWRGLEPLVRLELQRYADSLGVSIKQALDEAEPGMESAAIRQAPLPDGMRRAMAAAPAAVATTTELILKTRINTNTLGKL